MDRERDLPFFSSLLYTCYNSERGTMNKLDATLEKKVILHSFHYSLDNKDQGWNVAAIGQRIREMSTHYALVFKALDTSCNCEIKY